MKWRPGPQVPAQAVRWPVSSASAPAAKAPASIDLAAIDGVGDPVQRVSDDAVTVLQAGCLQCFDQYVGYSFAHSGTSRISCHVRKLTSRHGDLQEGELDGAQPRDAKKNSPRAPPKSF
jgi:hypothetical protein